LGEARAILSSALLAACVGTGAATAGAQHAADVLEEATDLLRRFEYGRAIEVLGPLVEAGDGSPRDLEARALLAEAYASRGDETAASREARALYRRDPGYELPNRDRLSPPLRAVFERAASEVRSELPAAADVEVDPRGDHLLLRIAAEVGPALVARVIVAYEVDGGGLRRVEAEGAGSGWTARLPAGDRVTYRVRLATPSGFTVARAGTAAEPRVWTRGVAGATDPEEGEQISSGTSAFDGAVPWIVAGAAVLVAGGVAIAIWQPWQDGPTIGEPIQIP